MRARCLLRSISALETLRWNSLRIGSALGSPGSALVTFLPGWNFSAMSARTQERGEVAAAERAEQRADAARAAADQGFLLKLVLRCGEARGLGAGLLILLLLCDRWILLGDVRCEQARHWCSAPAMACRLPP